jgi:hypothetical protein
MNAVPMSMASQDVPAKLPSTARRTAPRWQVHASLEMVGNGLERQPELRMARVVEFGFCTGLPARLSIR